MSATDTLRTKTDEELRFFVENPQYYQPELVLAARRELQRRGGPAPQPPVARPLAPAAEPTTHDAEPIAYATEPEPTRQVGTTVGLGVGAVALLAGGWLWWQAHTKTAQASARQQEAAAAARLSPEALKLESVATYAVPTFDVPQLVQEQLASVPAAQKRDEQALRQFRALSKRFWAAETQSEYLTNAAYTHTTAPTFAEQAQQAREAWQTWNHAAVYTFKFGPVMSKQFELMKEVGSSQQYRLERLPRLLAKNKFLTDKELNARQVDVEAWMAGLRRTSPVTGRAYRNEAVEMHL